jgi:hypothetical protein
LHRFSGTFGPVVQAQGVGAKQRAWLIPVSSEQPRSPGVPTQLLEAWTATVREWDWQGPATRERNVNAILSHYHVDRDAVTGVPPGLAADWCREGRPEPSAWIEAKLDAILSEESRRSVA